MTKKRHERREKDAKNTEKGEKYKKNHEKDEKNERKIWIKSLQTWEKKHSKNMGKREFEPARKKNQKWEKNVQINIYM